MKKLFSYGLDIVFFMLSLMFLLGFLIKGEDNTAFLWVVLLYIAVNMIRMRKLNYHLNKFVTIQAYREMLALNHNKKTPTLQWVVFAGSMAVLVFIMVFYLTH